MTIEQKNLHLICYGYFSVFFIYNDMIGKSKGVYNPFILRNAYHKRHLQVKVSAYSYWITNFQFWLVNKPCRLDENTI